MRPRIQVLRDVPLPKGMEWYESVGQTIFILYGENGGILCKEVAFLIDKGVGIPTFNGRELPLPKHGVRDYGCGWRVLAVPIDVYASDSAIRTEIRCRICDMCMTNLFPKSKASLFFTHTPEILGRKIRAFLAA